MDKVIDTRLVYGFLDAGKTTYIRENVSDDVFYKYGKTLIICFEEGEEDFDHDELAEKNASVVYYEDGDIGDFVSENIAGCMPDRIYVEMNAMVPEIRDALPDCLKVTFSIMLIDWSTMPVYYNNFMQLFKQMASDANQVVFRGCPSSELLAPYSQAFRLMNPKAQYLRRDPMGYHEKAFELFLPYSLDGPVITVSEKEYLPFWLDAFDHPEHYDGKTIVFSDPLEIRRNADSGRWSCGRVVMTCCMADLQFMSFALDQSLQGLKDSDDISDSSWAKIKASSHMVVGAFGQRRLVLTSEEIQITAPPEEVILDGRKS